MVRAQALTRAAAALLFAAIFCGSVSAGDLRAYFDRDTVYEGDTLTLVIETEGDALEQPDLSALEKDFALLGTSQSTQISIVNGDRTDTKRWLVSLMPKRTGTIQVPALQVGGKATSPLTLQVSEVPTDASPSPGDGVFVEVELGSGDEPVVVQQQVPLTVRLFSSVRLLDGSLDDPRAADALVQKLGDDRRYVTQRNGREYQVIERRYVLSPEKSGELRIPPVVFKGSVRSSKQRRSRLGGRLFDDTPFEGFFGNQRLDRFFNDDFFSRDPFSMFERGEPVRAQSQAISLEVQASPEGFTGDHWLPAQELVITDSWAEKPPELRVGEPVTRTLTLEARGLDGSQIPEIDLPQVPGVRIYRDKTKSETRSDGETVYGVSRQGLTLIPSAAGELEIPEIRIAWWDTAAREERMATLPSWRFKVDGGSLGAAAVPTTPETAPDVAPVDQVAQAADAPEAGREWTSTERAQLIGGAALAILFGLLARILLRRRRKAAEKIAETRRPEAAQSHPRPSEARKALRRACEANDPRAAAQALHDWATEEWPEGPPRNLGALADRLADGAEPVRALEQRLYAPDADLWDGAALWQALKDGLRRNAGSEVRRDDGLAPLYPQRT